MSSLLARFAENSFWLARYMERAENLARILEINEIFARDVRGQNDWLPILKLHGDEQKFAELYKDVSAQNVIRFYISNAENPNSIRSTVSMARENARSVRHLISLEVWSELNVLYNWVNGLKPRDVSIGKLSRLCDRLKHACQLHTGAVQATLYRDQVWMFYRLGRFIERADQATRLVDIKYKTLLPKKVDEGSAIDVAQWNALLRSAAAYHSYRRAYPRTITPETVTDYILFDPLFPRSLPACAAEMRQLLNSLSAQEELQEVKPPERLLRRFERLSRAGAKKAISKGMDVFVEDVQISVSDLSDHISKTYFPADAA